MDTRAPWARTREWARGWVWTLSFWAVTALSAVAALFLGLAVTGDWSAAAGWAVVGAPIGVALALLARWATTPWRDVRELSLELAEELRTANEQAEEAAHQTGITEAPTWDERAGREKAFQTYVGRQLTALADIIAQVERTIGDYGWTETDWDDFTSLAWRTTSGLRRFDDDLGDYVTATLEEVHRKYENEGPDPVELLFLAKRVVTAIEEARDLYQP